jgi:hypothetical protein
MRRVVDVLFADVLAEPHFDHDRDSDRIPVHPGAATC